MKKSGLTHEKVILAILFVFLLFVSACFSPTGQTVARKTPVQGYATAAPTCPWKDACQIDAHGHATHPDVSQARALALQKCNQDYNTQLASPSFFTCIQNLANRCPNYGQGPACYLTLFPRLSPCAILNNICVKYTNGYFCVARGYFILEATCAYPDTVVRRWGEIVITG